MRLSLSTRRLPGGASSGDLTALLERLRLDLVHVACPGRGAARRWMGLRAAKVGVGSVAVWEALGAADAGTEFESALAEACDVAAGLRAGAVVVEGGRAPGASREKAVEAALRRLYGPLTSGAPLALRPAASAEDLFGFEETGWALDALRRLSLWFDPARALSLSATPPREAAPLPTASAWADRFAGRMAGIHLDHAPGEEHPGVGAMVRLLPTRVPWVLDVAASVPERDLVRAIDYLRSFKT